MAEEVEPSTLKKTQEILSGVIKKPPLTEKNLKRPPFRFLHDIITNVIKSTGFMKGLYSSEEMSSDNIKDKDSKMAFLQKAIDLIVLVTDTPVNLKPTKVVAGHEVQKTNEFLQILGLAAKSKIDTKEAVETVLQKLNHKDRKASVDKRHKGVAEKSHVRSTTKTLDSVKKTSQGSLSKENKSKEVEKSRSRSKESKSRIKDKPKEKSRSKREDSKSRDSKKVPESSKDAKANSEASPRKKPFQNGHPEDIADAEDENMAVPESPQISPFKGHTSSNVETDELIQPMENLMQEEKPQPVQSSHQSRPPSARSKRTKLESTSARFKNAPPNTLQTNNADGHLSPMPRPPSARPSSSRPAPPRIRIRHIVESDEPSIRPETAKPVENVIIDQKIDGEDDDEDSTFIVTEEPLNDIQEPSMVSSGVQETPDEDKGSLVKQLLETKKDLEGGSQMAIKKVEIDKSQLASNRVRETSSKDLEQLQCFIQSVSKTAYPLGRTLDYLQEDIDSMKMELRMWKDEHKQNLNALSKEKNTTESILEPLRVQLDDLDQMVQDQIDANSALKANILRNDDRIQRMLLAIQRNS